MAKKTISQRVALEGGDDVKKQLEDIGKEGREAFDSISDTAEEAKLSLKFGNALVDLQRQLGKVGDAGRDVARGFRDLGAAGANIAKNLAFAGAAIGGAAAGLVLFAKQGTEVADAQGKAAQAAGVQVEAFGALAFAADQSGVSQEQLGTALNFLNRQLGDVAGGNEKAAEKFRALGVQVKGANGQLRPTEDILKDLADRLSAMPDGAEKSALAIDFLGRSGANLLPLLNQGAAGIDNLMARARMLGITFSEEQVKVAEGMNDALSELNQARVGVQAQLGLLFAPVITEAATAITDAIIRNRDAILDLAQRGLAVAVPLIEDFINALVGNDEAVRAEWVIRWRDNIIGFGQAVSNVVQSVVIPAWNALIGVADQVAAAINGVFGTDITGQEVLITAAIAKMVGAFGLIAPALVIAGGSIKVITELFKGIGPAARAVQAGFALVAGAGAKLLIGLGGLVGWPGLLVAAFAGAVALIVIYWDEIKAGAQVVWDFIVGLFADIGQWIADGFAAAGALIGEVWADVKATAGALWEDLKSGFASTWDRIESGAKATASFIRDTWRGLKSVFREFDDAARQREAARGASFQEDFSFAGGGMVRGPGTATSDSILARLSNGEFVVRAAAVRHYGPQLLAALNSLRLPRQGFALGGLVHGLTSGVSGALPRFADGGLVAVPAGGGGRPLTLQIDGQTISGLTASPAAVEQIERFTTNRVLRSTGRRPGWMG